MTLRLQVTSRSGRRNPSTLLQRKRHTCKGSRCFQAYTDTYQFQVLGQCSTFAEGSKAVFENVMVAEDLMEMEVMYREDEEI